MRNFIIYLFSISMLIGLNTSCKNNSPIEETKEVQSVLYNSSSKEFTIKYINGFTETVKATIDNSTTPPSAYVKLKDGTTFYVNNASEDSEAEILSSKEVKGNEYVNDWIHEEMSIYYYWNTKIPRNPNMSLKPDKFFDSILYKFGPSQPDGDRFSWIQDDYKELQGSLSGVASDEIGFDYIRVAINEAKTQYFVLVTYTKHGTSAWEQGIARGQFITAVNGNDITSSNYRTLLGGTGSKTLSRAQWAYNKEKNNYSLEKMDDVKISMHKNFAENPLYIDSVFTVDDKKIGYIVYNFFATDKGDKSHSYDKDLMNRLKSIKDRGATEMVLDLRYNSGGSVSSAIALSSALVKDRNIKNILVTSEYNSIVHNALKGEYGADYNKEYFIDKISTSTGDIAIPSLSNDRIFILTGQITASASEFIINGLKPYMDVVLIGETTYGKNVGSITIYEEDDPKNKWGMQPIIVKYKNSLGNSDFTDGFSPDYPVDEFEELHLVPFGDTEDPLLAKAISVITGKEPTTTKATTSFRSSQIDKSKNISIKSPLKFEMVDDVNGEAIREIFKNK